MAKKLLLITFFISFSMFSQNEKALIFGSVRDSTGIVKNANIINLKTNQGTFSNDNGEFKMVVSLGDSLRISSIQHKIIFAVVSNFTLKNKKIKIYLQSLTIELDEIELKKHDLIGVLGIDNKKVPVDKKDSLLRRTMDFSKIDMTVVEADDYIDTKVRPPIVNTIPNSFSGAGGSVSIPFKDSERYWALVRELNFKESFPGKLFSDLGEKFFFVDLKIPPEKYYHFLEYCNPLGIENLYRKGKLIEVIQILRKENITYLEIIKEN